MEINFSKGDLLAGMPIPPNWYKGKIIQEELKTREGSIDYVITLDFEDPLLSNDDRKIDHTFWNCVGKGKGFLIPYMASLLNMNIREVTDKMEKGQNLGFLFGEGQNVGKKIQFKVTNEQYQGRILNKVESFLPYSSEVPF